MKLKLENFGQFKKAEVGTIIPIHDHGSYVEGSSEGMIKKIKGEGIDIFTINKYGACIIYKIKDIDEEIGIVDGRFWFTCDGINENVDLEKVEEGNPIIEEYKEKLK